MEQCEGKILKGIGGFYYIQTDKGVIECHPRGIFRRQGKTPVAGDEVLISIQENGNGIIESIMERKNILVRPPVANVDCLVMVISLVQPVPNLQIVDTMLAVAENKGIDAIVVINKSDLAEASPIREIYEHAGYTVFVVSAKEKKGITELKNYIAKKTCVFTGNTGVGKSSLLNLIDESLVLETGETSIKLGRGRHTTRTSILYPQENGGYIVDTPGFSSLALEKLADISPEEVFFCFREFEPYFAKCKFTGCRHIGETGCVICKALEEGKLETSRYLSYKALLETTEKAASSYDGKRVLK